MHQLVGDRIGKSVACDEQEGPNGTRDSQSLLRPTLIDAVGSQHKFVRSIISQTAVPHASINLLNEDQKTVWLFLTRPSNFILNLRLK